MTPEMSRTFWTVMLGSDSLNSSFGNRPMPCSIFALLQSLATEEGEQNRSVTTHLSENAAKAGKSIFPNPMITLSAVFTCHHLVLVVWNVAVTISVVPSHYFHCRLFTEQLIKFVPGPLSAALRYITKRSREFIVNGFKKLHNSVSVMRFRCR